MEKKEHKSPHGWFIILWIVFTLCVFLLTMVYTIEQENDKETNPQSKKERATNSPVKKLTVSPMTTLLPASVKIVRGGKVLYRHDKLDIIADSLKRHLHSLPDVISNSNESDEKKAYSTKDISLSLHGYEINSISVGKSFYIYDCNIVPTAESLVVSILMELPEIKVDFKDHPEYSQYCPLINPYIHVVELIYLWNYNKNTLKPHHNMKLTNLKIFMVSWKDNLYRKSYEQVKNSPLHNVKTPIPLDLKKEELYNFLMESNIFNEVFMIFNPEISLQSIQNNTPIQ
jgi:hypothetical protein